MGPLEINFRFLRLFDPLIIELQRTPLVCVNGFGLSVEELLNLARITGFS